MPDLRFAVLGPVLAWRRDAELNLGSPQQRTVLAVLLLAGGRQVALSALIDALWGDEPPRAASGTVRTYVSRLRRSLGSTEDRDAGGVIESAGDGYLLPLRSAVLDLNVFLRLTADARTAAGAGDAGRAAALLRDALGLWHGVPLAGLPGEYAASQRVRLTELQLAATEDRLALDVELGGHVAAAAELRALLPAYPLRERLSELLMLALYRSGRQADSLAVFAATRRLLADELGIDPGPALQEMHRRILQTDESLMGTAGPQPPEPAAVPRTLTGERVAAARPPPAAAPSPARSRGPRPLPVAATSLLGREQAVVEVAELVERPGVRLVTLTGPGGVGKTRLAMAAGERLRDRSGAETVFVPLAAVTQPGLILDGVGRAVGADLVGTDSPVEALAEQFGDDRWLLILDNLDQVAHGAGDLGELLARCGGVTLLATSRTALALQAEREYPVPPLPLPADPLGVLPGELAASPAVALFVDRARAVRPGFALTEANAAAVAEICRRLEGLPLAIELAAARTRLLDPGTLLDRLSGSLDALGTGPVDVPERQHTLRATVEWSLGLLDDTERSLLEVVAVFADGWTIEAAAQVAVLDQDQALKLSETLARHSLLSIDTTGLGPRLRMLETIRAFVAERLAARPDAGEIQRRHAGYYRALAEQADRPLRGTGHTEWLDRLEAEAANLAGAVRWYLTHDPRPLPHLFRILWPFWSLRDHLGEAIPWIRELQAATGPLDPQAEAELVWTAVLTFFEVGDDGAALAARQRLGLLLDGIKDPFLRALSGLAMAWSSRIPGDLDHGVRDVSVSLELLRGQDEPFWTAMAVGSLGPLEIALGRYDDALRHLIEMRDLGELSDSPWVTVWSRVQLGILAVVRGRPDEARAPLQEALDRSLTARSTRSVILCLAAFAQLAFAEGDPERAALVAGAADGLRHRAGPRAWPATRRGEAELVDQVRQALGADRFGQAFTAGTRLSLREAVATVRSWHVR